MLTSTEHTELENKLIEIFGYINTWLHHAEAKNAAIIAAVGAAIFSFSNYKNDLNIYVFFILNLILILSLLISLFSFYPNFSNTKVEKINNIILKIPELFDKKNKNTSNSNIKIFYLDIANNYKFNQNEKYIIDLYKSYKNITISRNNITELEKDYAKEIIINSQITVNKYNYFKCSLLFFLLFLVNFFFSLMIAEFYNKSTEIIVQNNLIIRNSPSITSEQIGKLNKHDKVIKLSEKENWIKIKTNEQVGWVYKIYLDKK